MKIYNILLISYNLTEIDGYKTQVAIYLQYYDS